MRALEVIRTIFSTIADSMATSRRGSRFTCGDCERNEHCGQPPNDNNCVVKAAQMPDDDEYRRPAPTGYYKAVWPR